MIPKTAMIKGGYRIATRQPYCAAVQGTTAQTMRSAIPAAVPTSPIACPRSRLGHHCATRPSPGPHVAAFTKPTIAQGMASVEIEFPKLAMKLNNDVVMAAKSMVFL